MVKVEQALEATSVRVCPGCRLVQRPDAACTHCGSRDLLPAREARLKLQPRQEDSSSGERKKTGEVWGGVVTLLFAGLLYLAAQFGSGLSVIIIVGGGLALVMAAVLVWVVVAGDSSPPRWRGVKLPVPRSYNAGETEGTVARLEETVSSHLNEDECVAASLVFEDEGAGTMYLRSVRSAEFALRSEDEQDQMTIVRGSLQIDLPKPDAARPPRATNKVVRGLRRGGDWGFPVGAREYLVRVGDRVRVSGGEQTNEAVPALAGTYREAGRARVLHGVPGNPVRITRAP